MNFKKLFLCSLLIIALLVPGADLINAAATPTFEDTDIFVGYDSYFSVSSADRFFSGYYLDFNGEYPYVEMSVLKSSGVSFYYVVSDNLENKCTVQKVGSSSLYSWYYGPGAGTTTIGKDKYTKMCYFTNFPVFKSKGCYEEFLEKGFDINLMDTRFLPKGYTYNEQLGLITAGDDSCDHPECPYPMSFYVKLNWDNLTNYFSWLPSSDFEFADVDMYTEISFDIFGKYHDGFFSSTYGDGISYDYETKDLTYKHGIFLNSDGKAPIDYSEYVDIHEDYVDSITDGKGHIFSGTRDFYAYARNYYDCPFCRARVYSKYVKFNKTAYDNGIFDLDETDDNVVLDENMNELPKDEYPTVPTGSGISGGGSGSGVSHSYVNSPTTFFSDVLNLLNEFTTSVMNLSQTLSQMPQVFSNLLSWMPGSMSNIISIGIILVVVLRVFGR